MDNTAEIKNYLHKLVVETDDVNILTQIKDYFKQLKSKKTDWYDELTKQQKEDIETSRKQFREGKGIPHSEVQKEVDKLLGRK